MQHQFLGKKTAIALALVGAFAASSAHADVKVVDGLSVFGLADLSLQSSQAPVSGTTSNLTPTSGAMTTSYFGIKGERAVGSTGLTAGFSASTFLDLTKGSVIGPNLFTRNASGSLAGSFGKVTIGRDIAPHFLPTILFNAYGDSGGYGPLWHAMYFNFNTPSQKISNSTSNGLYGDTAWDRQIIYTLPKFGNAEINLHYAPNNGTASGNNFGANVLYFDGPLALTAYYSNTQVMPIGNSEIGMDIFTVGNNAAQAYMAGASYDFGVAKVFMTYQDAKQSSANTDSKVFHVSTKIPAGPGKILLAYANTNYSSNLVALNAALGGVSSTVNETVVGYDYPLDDKTDAYVNYGYTSASNTSGTGYVYGAGIRMKF